MLKRWNTIFMTGNLPPGEVAGPELDLVSRWLLITRFCVMPMTLFAGLIGGLLALYQREAVNWSAWTLAIIGLLLAHTTNNMANDLLDWWQGVDTSDYPRATYAPHPIRDKLISPTGLIIAVLVTILVDFVIALALTELRGWLVMGLAIAGIVLSLGYVAPPLSLKRRGLGELVVLIVWGPLMIGGAYLSATGHLPAWVLWASLPYGLLVTCVLLGKHIDKLEYDLPKGVYTLPVLLGDSTARLFTRGALALFFLVTVFEVALGVLPLACLLVVLGLPRLIQVDRAFQKPKPYQQPADLPIWPLWFAAAAFLVVRAGGGAFVLGLILGAIWPFSL